MTATLYGYLGKTRDNKNINFTFNSIFLVGARGRSLLSQTDSIRRKLFVGVTS